jgi:hypothetical protein
MPQDSGAFKTIPRNRSGFRLIAAINIERTGRDDGKKGPPVIFNERVPALALFWIQPDSQ